MKTKMLVPRGMLYLYDPDAKGVVIPEYDPDESVTCSKNAVSIAAQSDEDGEVELELLPASKLKNDRKERIFSGTIQIENDSIAVCTMGDEQVFSLPVQPGAIWITITSNLPKFPELVSVYVESK